MSPNIAALIDTLLSHLREMEPDDCLNTLNEIRERLHKVSPLRDQPVDTVRWVPAESIQANEYNPNKIPTPEMRLLETSVLVDGYTMPIVCYHLGDGKYEIVDGFHRNRIGKESPIVQQRLKGRLPITIINKPIAERMGSTIRHNRARGVHQTTSMTSIVVSLVNEGWSDEDICIKLGMSREEVLRFKQASGLREAFANHVFSRSWEEFESNFVPSHVPEMSGVKKTVAVQKKNG